MITAQDMTPVKNRPKPLLENDHIRIEFAEDGSLSHLMDKSNEHRYAGGTALWRLYLQNGEELDIELNPDGKNADFELSEERVDIYYRGLHYQDQPIDLDVHVSCTLYEDELHWEIELSQDTPGITVRECHFPLLGNFKPRADEELILTIDGGKKITDLTSHLKAQDTLYKAPDHRFLGTNVNYPYAAACNCYTFAGKTKGLYMGCHTTVFERTLQQFRLYPDSGIEIGFVRFPNLGAGDSWRCGTYVTSLYEGSWHIAARKYRSWANSWYRTQPAPEWVRKLNGWQRIIMLHQYGEIHYNFEQMADIYADGHAAGIDCLFMFGWHRGGHDNNYPDYVPSPRLGSEEALKEGIEAFNKQGGQVILYTSGRLVDSRSEYYKNEGHKHVIKDFLGNEIRESYRFRGSGNFVNEFANRTVHPICPSSQEWREVLKSAADKAADWKCRAFFMDQQGTCEYPCCDPTHDHPPLWMGTITAKAETVRELREHVRARDPEMAVGIEILTDITAQHADFVHNMTGACVAHKGWEESGKKPIVTHFVDWFRYAFPEVILSDREIRDDTDIERRVNHAVLKGLRSDIEIYRCRKSIAETPHYASYLKQVNALRQRLCGLLLKGTYRDIEGFSWDNPEIDARAFEGFTEDGQPAFAIVLTQSHLDNASTLITLDPSSEYRFHKQDGIGDVTFDAKTGRVTLARHALAVLICIKE